MKLSPLQRGCRVSRMFPCFTLLSLGLIASSNTLRAQATGIDQPLNFIAPSTGGKFIQWHGLTTRTYFTQVSDPADHLSKWNWAPVIESGNDQDISYEVDGTANKGFFRLKYTDQPLDPGKTVETSDFDKDGISNIDEIDPPASTIGGPTDPLNSDTDGDGINDGFERTHGYNPNNSDENENGVPDGQDNNNDGDGDGKSTLEEYLAGTSDSNGDDYTESEIVGPILWERRWATAGSSKTGLFRQFTPTVPPNPPTPLISYYLTKTLTNLEEATTSGPTYSKYGTTDTTTLNPTTLEIATHVTNIDFNISQPTGSNYYPNFNNGVWEVVTKSETHSTTKSVDEIAGSGSYKITSNGYTGSETYSYKTSLSDEYTTQMLIAAGDVKFAEMAAQKENEPWGYNYFPVIDISTYTEKDEQLYSRTETDYALEPRYSPDAPVRVAWLDVNRTDLGRGYLGGTPDPAAIQSITLHEKYYSKEKAAIFQQPPGIAETPRTEIRRLAPELNKARLILPLGCSLGMSLDPGSMIASHDATGQPLPIDWEDPYGGYLSVDFQHGHWTNYVQYGDVVSDEFDVPIKLEALEGGEKIRLAEIITTSAGTAYLPINLPIADVRGFTEGFVVQTVDPGKIVLKASLTTKHGLKVSKRSDADVLLPVEVAVDADRDGEITFVGKDKTTAEKPYRFWINNDQDDVEADEPVTVDQNERDLLDSNIKTSRDLEDFSRISISVGIPLDQLQQGKFKVGLKFKNSTTTGPAIRVWPNESNAGSRDYLTDGTAAVRQRSKNCIGDTLNGTTFIPASYWSDRPDSKAHLIFEGVKKGQGELVLVVKPETTAEVESASIYLNLLDVREMYQRARIANEAEQIPDPWVDDTPPAQTWSWDPWNWPYSVDPDAKNITAVFVHGWRLTYMEFMGWSDSSYKRLWHQGFKGKFYSFRWATYSPSVFTYNDSEYRAWLCGPALATFVNQLPNAGRRSLFAHSMGNVITGCALRNGMSVQHYGLCNAAMASMAYDPNPALKNNPDTGSEWNNIFLGFAPHKTPDTDPVPAIRDSYGIKDKFNSGTVPRKFNLGLKEDTALRTWVDNNLLFKPDANGHSYYYQDVPQPPNLTYKLFQAPPVGNPREVTSQTEAMAYVTKSLTRTAGADLRTRGSIQDSHDMSGWGVGANHSGFGETHSAQWRWSNQSTHLFWEKLFEELELEE